jgi:hypothetical protein
MRPISNPLFRGSGDGRALGAYNPGLFSVCSCTTISVKINIKNNIKMYPNTFHKK